MRHAEVLGLQLAVIMAAGALPHARGFELRPSFLHVSTQPVALIEREDGSSDFADGDDDGFGLRSDPCEGSLYSNGAYDSRNGLANMRSANGKYRVADDISLTRDANITGLAWYTADDNNFNWSAKKMDIQILQGDGADGGPGTIIIDIANDTQGTRTDTGDTTFNRHMYVYENTKLNIDVSAGHIWLHARPVTTSSNVRSYWLTTEVQGMSSYQTSANDGPWKTTSDYDVSWCLFGTLGPAHGACCFISGDCSQLTQPACTDQGGDYQGDDTACDPNPCPQSPLLGDMNCDDRLNFDDIDGFVLAINSKSDYESAYPDCHWLNGDINKSDNVDFDDIGPFVECLINNGCP